MTKALLSGGAQSALVILRRWGVMGKKRKRKTIKKDYLKKRVIKVYYQSLRTAIACQPPHLSTSPPPITRPLHCHCNDSGSF